MALSAPLLRPLSTTGAAVLSKTEVYKGYPSSDCDFTSCLTASVVYPLRNATKHFEANPFSIISGHLDMFGHRL
jgi:hypothetical protein